MSTDAFMQAELAHCLRKSAALPKKLLKRWKDKHLDRSVKLARSLISLQSNCVNRTALWVGILGCPAGNDQTMMSFHTRCIRRIRHIFLKQRLSNEHILGECRMEKVEAIIWYKRPMINSLVTSLA